MLVPPLLVGSTLLFWGYLSDALFISLLMAIPLELKKVVKWRYTISNAQFYGIGDICTAILILIAAIAFFYSQQRLFIYQIVSWLPYAFYFLVLAESYSDQNKTPLGALIYRYRKLPHSAPNEICLGYLYFFLCLLSASATDLRSEWFFPITLMLLAYGLIINKAKSTHPLRWSIIFLAIGGTGFVAELGLYKLHHIIEEYSIDLLESLFESERDPFQMTTAMGRIGKLKLSNKIIMRVKANNGNVIRRGKPFLLQEAVYNVFYDNAWFNTQATFEAVLPSRSKNSWSLSTSVTNSPTTILYIDKQKFKSRGLLAIPSSAFEIQADTNLILSKNSLGAIQYRSSPDLEQYRILISTNIISTVKTPPKLNRADLLVPVDQRIAILEIHKTLHTDTNSSFEKIKNIKQYFSSKYTYSTFLRPSSNSLNPLVHFLRGSHSGHCEFFASATVLLLRAAGIPARYSVGYSVQEYNEENNIYIVRARHRHAWAKAFIDGIWINVDTTPAAWIQADKETASAFEPITDWISQQLYRFEQWQRKNSEQQLNPIYYLLLFAIGLFLFFYIRAGKQQSLGRARNVKTTHGQLSDSAYTIQIKRILDVLQLAGITWEPHEPLLIRAKKCQTIINDPIQYQALKDIIGSYYKLRFDQQALTPDKSDDSLTQLQFQVDNWLGCFKSSQSRH